MNIHREGENRTKCAVVASSRFWVGLILRVQVWRLADILKVVFRTKCQMMRALHHARVTCTADANEAYSYKTTWGWMTTALLKALNIPTYIFNASHFAHASLCRAYMRAPVDRPLCRTKRSRETGVIFVKEPWVMRRHYIFQLWTNGTATLLRSLIKAAVLYSHWNEGIFLKPKQLYYSYINTSLVSPNGCDVNISLNIFNFEKKKPTKNCQWLWLRWRWWQRFACVWARGSLSALEYSS